MKCIILCAGYATRLYPLTQDQPKPLISVGERTILDHIIKKVEQIEDIDEVFVITNDRFHSHFSSWHGSAQPQKKVHIVNDGTNTNETRLGAVGDIHYVIKNHEFDDDVMIIAGDNLFEFSLEHFINFFKQKEASTIALYDLKEKEKVAKKFGVALVDDTHRVVDFEEKPEDPKSTLAGTCCYILKKESVQKIHDYMNQEERKDNPGDFIQWLKEKENIYGFTFTDSWFDIGSFEALEEASKKYGDKNAQ